MPKLGHLVRRMKKHNRTYVTPEDISAILKKRVARISVAVEFMQIIAGRIEGVTGAEDVRCCAFVLTAKKSDGVW